MLPFHPVISKWFTEKVGTPTDVQNQSWPKIAEGKNVLLTAPTGSGKTMASFLWALNQLLTGTWEGEQTRVLYISPLKALNNDIRINLLEPLKELQNCFNDAEEEVQPVNVTVRSGDTPQSERRKMLKRPPEILITTPESLNLLLSTRSGQGILTGIQCVILDEIHSVVDSKRGTHLMTAVDRLVELSGDFQRIALSATIQPLEQVAEFVGGFIIEESSRGKSFVPRPMEIIRAQDERTYDFKITFPEDAVDRDSTESFIDVLAPELKKAIDRNRSTLIFTNSRKMCEKLTLKINSGEEKPIAYSHHGSLSKEIRHEVEQKLKAGELKAIVATHSLELGIDIGFLDEVLLVQAPFSVSSAMQRIGRAGHKVGQVSVATLYPTHAQDFIESAVLSKAIQERSIEPVHPVMAPLDVLAQIIISMVATDPRKSDDIYFRLRSSYPYHTLDRQVFDLVLHMLAGRYGDSRIRELNPRIAIDSVEQTVTIRKGTQLQLFLSGGTIPDRGYYHIRHSDSGAKIGELDEEFVWEAHIGKVFTIGAQRWKIEKITHNDVFVRPGSRTGSEIPFWNAEEYGRDFFFSEKILNFLADINTEKESKKVHKDLVANYAMDTRSADQLIEYCRKQKSVTEVSLPHRNHIVIEHITRGPGGAPGNQVVIHNFWGGKINKPIAMAIDAAWEEQYGQRIEVFGGNDAIALILPHEVDAAGLWGLIPSGSLETLLRKRLEGSGFFGARFREAAGRALLVTRNKAKERMPLWMTRLKSHKLMDTVMKYTDFPILLETWRTCLQDEFDLENCHRLIEEIERGKIEVSEVYTATPSPMAAGIAYDQISDYMYRRDKQTTESTSALSDELLREVALNEGIRPAIPMDVVREFEEKRQRLRKGYLPTDSLELVEWVKERRVIPESEWECLLEKINNEIENAESVLSQSAKRLIRLSTDAGSVVLCRDDLYAIQTIIYSHFTCNIKSLENKSVRLSEKEKQFSEDLTASILISEILSFYGPVTTEIVRKSFCFDSELFSTVLDELLEDNQIIAGQLIESIPETMICDLDNYETLLRVTRASAQPIVESKPIGDLAYYLAHWQGVVERGDSAEDLFERLEQLNGVVASAGLWEREILPARMLRYDPAWIDAVLSESDLSLYGARPERCGFTFLDDFELVTVPQEDDDLNRLTSLFPEHEARYDLLTLVNRSEKSASEVTSILWNGFWDSSVSNSSFAALRTGIQTKFTTGEEQQKVKSAGRFARRRFSVSNKRSTTLPYAGTWFTLPVVEASEDVVEREELKKERVRILFDRYGILFRELLQREAPLFQWREIFRTLRLMELSGEITSGYFFEGVPGPQFISHRALHQFMHRKASDELFWIHAQDPASLCGIQIDELKGQLPRRAEGTHICYMGTAPVLISQKNGSVLTINLEPDHPRLVEIFAPLRNLLDRRFEPKNRIVLETINEEPANRSEYLNVLKVVFDVSVDYKGVTLYHRF